MMAPSADSDSQAPAKPYQGGAVGGSGSKPFAPVPAERVSSWPAVTKEIKAKYPEQALNYGVEGTVKLRIDIDASGKTFKVRVLKKLGYGLDEAAVAAVKRFVWAPAVSTEGRPVPVRITYAYTFRLPF